MLRARLAEAAVGGRGRRRTCRCGCGSGGGGGGRSPARRCRRGRWRRRRRRGRGRRRRRLRCPLRWRPRGGARRPRPRRRGSWAPACGRSTTSCGRAGAAAHGGAGAAGRTAEASWWISLVHVALVGILQIHRWIIISCIKKEVINHNLFLLQVTPAKLEADDDDGAQNRERRWPAAACSAVPPSLLPAAAKMNRGRRWPTTPVEHEDDEGDLGASELATDDDESKLHPVRNELSVDEQRLDPGPMRRKMTVEASSLEEGDEGRRGLLLPVTKKTTGDAGSS